MLGPRQVGSSRKNWKKLAFFVKSANSRKTGFFLASSRRILKKLAFCGKIYNQPAGEQKYQGSIIMSNERVVLKYKSYIDETIFLPGNVLHALAVRESSEDYFQMNIWAIVDPDEDPGKGHYTLQCRGTGMNFNGEEGDHIDTVVTRSGLVWHFFESTKPWDGNAAAD